MKPTPVLRVVLQPSRYAAGALGAATVATALLLAFLPVNTGLRAAAILVAGVCGIHALRRNAASTPRSIAAIELGADRRAVMTDRCGQRIEGTVQPESHVGAVLTTLVLRPDGARRWQALAIWPDMMPADQFRRLRVLLRHGDRGSDQA